MFVQHRGTPTFHCTPRFASTLGIMEALARCRASSVNSLAAAPVMGRATFGCCFFCLTVGSFFAYTSRIA